MEWNVTTTASVPFRTNVTARWRGSASQRPTAAGFQGPCISHAATNSTRSSQPLVCIRSRCLLAAMSACLPCPDLPPGAVLQWKWKRGPSRQTGWFQNCDHRPSRCRSLELRLNTRTFTRYPPPYLQGQAGLPSLSSKRRTSPETWMDSCLQSYRPSGCLCSLPSSPTASGPTRSL